MGYKVQDYRGAQDTRPQNLSCLCLQNPLGNPIADADQVVVGHGPRTDPTPQSPDPGT